jgi:DNA-binding NarL/FixJ family response regulator
MPITVVLADDNEDHRLAVRLILELAGDVVSLVGEAEDGHEALDLVRRQRPDLVIADVVMPNLDGLELTALLKRELPGTKAIIITGYGRYDSVVSRSGADAYVSKQEISTGLVRTIREVVNRGPGRN